MLSNDQISQIKELLNNSQSILVVFPKEAKLDIQLAASSLYLSLDGLSQKELTLLCSKQPKNNNHAGLEEVKTELGNKNLQVSFPYNESQVDKVSYDIDEVEGRFYLLVQPQKNAKPLDYKKVEYAYTGAQADLIILVGVNNYESLEQLYIGYEQLYEDSTVIAINNYEPSIGDVKIELSGKTGLSESFVDLLESLELPIAQKAASNLLAGIQETSDNFQSLMATADTFETVAKLMRLGAKRTGRRQEAGGNRSGTEVGSFGEALGKKPEDKRPKTGDRGQGKKVEKLKKLGKTSKAGGLDYKPSGLK